MAPKRKQTKTLVIDAGNGNVKVSIGGETELIPSLLSTNDGSYIRGGFQLANDNWILGWDNLNRVDRIAVADKDTGKLDYLHLLVAGAISAMSHAINPGDKLDIHLLTLNNDKRELLAKAIDTATSDLSIDGTPMLLEAKLANVFPEGYGASLYASSVFGDVRRMATLDLGNGTLNLSQYYRGLSGLPRREMFSFVPAGVQTIVELTSDLLATETSNGRVDEGLVRQALDTNSYRYLSSYEGIDIWEIACKAVDTWLQTPKVKQTMIQVMRLVNSGVPVVLVGGGFSLHCVQQKVTEVLNKRGQDNLIHTAENPLTVGVQGLANNL